MIEYMDECQVDCIDTDTSATADVDFFKPEEKLIVYLGENTIHLTYNQRGLYIGSKFGMEFISKGPLKIERTNA